MELRELMDALGRASAGKDIGEVLRLTREVRGHPEAKNALAAQEVKEKAEAEERQKARGELATRVKGAFEKVLIGMRVAMRDEDGLHPIGLLEGVDAIRLSFDEPGAGGVKYLTVALLGIKAKKGGGHAGGARGDEPNSETIIGMSGCPADAVKAYRDAQALPTQTAEEAVVHRNAVWKAREKLVAWYKKQAPGQA